MVLLWPATAVAELVTLGVWSLAAGADNDGDPFFDGHSWDCGTCGIGWQLAPAAEYLHAESNPRRAVPFYWSNWQGGAHLGGQSAYLSEHRFTYDGWEFFLDNGHGFTARSGDGTNALLVRLVGLSAIRYWLWLEDLPPGANDADFQDHGLTWQEGPGSGHPDPGPAPVPEPGALMLVASGIAVGARRWLAARPLAADRDHP